MERAKQDGELDERMKRIEKRIHEKGSSNSDNIKELE